MQLLPNSMVVVTIGGHEEIVRWWSRKYWKDRRYREANFKRSHDARLRLLTEIAERSQKRINGPKVGSIEWVEKQKRELEAFYIYRNLDQNEEVMEGANAKKVAVILAYEGSKTEAIHHWAHRRSTKYWQTANIYQALMYWFHTTLRHWTRCPVRVYGLNPPEKIRLGRLKGDGYHGCGIYQKPMKPGRYGIG